MSARSAHLALAPERCDRCGRCVSACPRGALRVGGGYIYVDTDACNECMGCVEVCSRGAIARRGSARAVAAAGGGTRAVVSSRSEAKALKQSEIDARRERERADAGAARLATVQARTSRLDTADAEEGRVAWTLTEAGVVLAVMMASLFASDALLGSQALSSVPLEAQAAARSAVLAAFYTVQLLTLGFLAARRGARFSAAFGLGRMGRTRLSVAGSAVLVVALLIATRLASTLWGVSARAVGWEPPAAGGLTGVFGSGGAGLALAVLTVVVLGPLAEELSFRGVVLRAAGARWGIWPSILGTATLFAAYHVTAWTAVPLFVLGIALGWLAWKRRSLWSAIFLHALYNGVVVAAAYWLAQ